MAIDAYRVVLTGPAKRDLSDLAKYISINSPQAAEIVSDSILLAIESLAYMPTRFKKVGESRKRQLPIHWLIVAPYIVYYRIEPSSVYILRVRHGARRQLKRFD